MVIFTVICAFWPQMLMQKNPYYTKYSFFLNSLYQFSGQNKPYLLSSTTLSTSSPSPKTPNPSLRPCNHDLMIALQVHEKWNQIKKRQQGRAFDHMAQHGVSLGVAEALVPDQKCLRRKEQGEIARPLVHISTVLPFIHYLSWPYTLITTMKKQNRTPNIIYVFWGKIFFCARVLLYCPSWSQTHELK